MRVRARSDAPTVRSTTNCHKGSAATRVMRSGSTRARRLAVELFNETTFPSFLARAQLVYDDLLQAVVVMKAISDAATPRMVPQFL